MEKYIERFEELKSLTTTINPTMLESYHIFSFVSGLRKGVKPMLKILKLITLMQAFV